MVDSLRRFKLFVGAALLVLALGNGFALKQAQVAAHDRCIELQVRQRTTGAALARMVEAHSADGNAHAAAVWAEYLNASRKAPPVKC